MLFVIEIRMVINETLWILFTYSSFISGDVKYLCGEGGWCEPI